MRLALVVGMSLLAGCIASPPVPSIEPTRASTSYPWTLVGCREIIAAFDVDPEAVAPFVPEGFEPGGGAAPGRTTMGIDAFACENGSYASFWVNVLAPDEMSEGADDVFVKWDTLVESADARDALEAIGAPVHAGRVTIEEGALPSGTIELDGLGRIALTITPGAPPRGDGGSPGIIREFQPSAAGLVVWNGTLSGGGATRAAGFADVPAGSIPAQIFGSTRIPGMMFIRDGELTDGTIALPQPR